MYPNVDLTFKNLQFALQMTNRHTFVLVGRQNSFLTAGSNITDPVIKINSYMSEKYLEPYIGP